jgi:hypothetical protein
VISPVLRAAAAEVRGEVDRVLLEEDAADLDVLGAAVEAVARSVVSVFSLDQDAAWWLAFDAITNEFLHDLDE